MRVTTSKSKNADPFYISRAYVNGKYVSHFVPLHFLLFSFKIITIAHIFQFFLQAKLKFNR